MYEKYRTTNAKYRKHARCTDLVHVLEVLGPGGIHWLFAPHVLSHLAPVAFVAVGSRDHSIR
jgi:hypothetical protein